MRSTAQGGGNILTDDLVFYVDAANPKSFINGNTTWDDMGGGNNGTLTNGPTFDSNNGGSIVFDGTDDYVGFGDVFGFERTDIFSIECWIKVDVVKSDKQTIISKIQNNSPNTGWLFDVRDSGKLTFLLVNSAANYLGYNVNSVITDINKWYHIAVTYDGSSDANGVEIYLDSVLQSGTIPSNNLSNTIINTVDMQIGARDGSNFPFDGNISNIKIYNKELSSTEVLQNYNAIKSRFGL